MIGILEEVRVTNDIAIILVRGLGLFLYENKGKVLIMKAILSHEINITFLSFFFSSLLGLRLSLCWLAVDPPLPLR